MSQIHLVNVLSDTDTRKAIALLRNKLKLLSLAELHQGKPAFQRHISLQQSDAMKALPPKHHLVYFIAGRGYSAKHGTKTKGGQEDRGLYLAGSGQGRAGPRHAATRTEKTKAPPPTPLPSGPQTSTPAAPYLAGPRPAEQAPAATGAACGRLRLLTAAGHRLAGSSPGIGRHGGPARRRAERAAPAAPRPSAAPGPGDAALRP